MWHLASGGQGHTPITDGELTGIRRTQAELMEVFAKAAQALPPPDLNYTWAQAPIRFEDALGRVIPVPSEYDWDVSFHMLGLSL
jgi:hypothetical protein